MKPPTSPLTYAEAEHVAEALSARWQGLTGLSVPPPQEILADLVQHVLRQAAVIIEGRGE